MRIDEYLRSYEFSEHHEIEIGRSPEKIFPLLKTTDFRRSGIIHLLFLLRGLPQKMATINGFIECGFIPLEEKENEELVLGFLLGLDGIKVVPQDEFKDFDDGGHVKGVWNFALIKRDKGILLSTETRVHCPNRLARMLFSIYWTVISYFSGIIRKEMLRLIKKEAESPDRD